MGAVDYGISALASSLTNNKIELPGVLGVVVTRMHVEP